MHYKVKKLQLSVTVHKDTRMHKTLKTMVMTLLLVFALVIHLIKLKKMASMFIQLQKLLNKQMSSWCYCQMKSKEMSIKMKLNLT
ncbi:Uncharacterised protein [Mycobacteroides abscessus subsp. abscessus]|nr:Uncharacterised protein [Mycobacteroides abscessus subsp. abscessus]